MRRFNITGLCTPDEDYMADISGKIEQIRKLVDRRSYFTINRARQYGKTTTMACLRNNLSADYLVALISFEGIDDESFQSSEAFCQMFLRLIYRSLKFTGTSDDYINSWLDNNVSDFQKLSEHITSLCKNHDIVLMIDEVDKTSNNRIFLHFLGMLRNKFLDRKIGTDYTFHSVILAGVYDIKNIKLKMINEGSYTAAASESKIYNSPWNIAVDFDIDMSFNPAEITSMLKEYEAEHSTGMDMAAIAEEIYQYTGGYPYLVSNICKHLDEELNKDWTLAGVRQAVKNILQQENTLFDDLFKNLENNQKLYNLIYDVLIIGRERTFDNSNPTIKMAAMYGIIRAAGQGVSIANKIFEIKICNYFITKDEESSDKQITRVLQYDVIKADGRFDMELCLKKFSSHYAELYNEDDLNFLEKHGRLIFLSYLRPLINGRGFYHIESQFTDRRRMDVVVDFGHDQFIIELKLWYGDAEHHKAYEQLLGYMDSKKASVGYLLTFDFRKDKKNSVQAEWVAFGDRRIFDVIV
jgi:hypothetical protein